MRSSQLARRRGLRAVARLGVIAGAVSVAALAGAHPAGASTTTVAARAALIQQNPDATSNENKEPDTGTPGGGGQQPGEAIQPTEPTPPTAPTAALMLRG